jgi:hypothetical protein
MPRKREYLTLDQAAELLGWVGAKRWERLLRVMFAKERLLGKTIMVRTGGSRQGTRYKLSEPMLQRYCPELFIATQDELVSDVRRHLSAIDGRVQAIIDERTAPEFEELRRADRTISKELARLGKHVEAIEKRIPAPKSS